MAGVTLFAEATVGLDSAGIRGGAQFVATELPDSLIAVPVVLAVDVSVALMILADFLATAIPVKEAEGRGGAKTSSADFVGALAVGGISTESVRNTLAVVAGLSVARAAF